VLFLFYTILAAYSQQLVMKYFFAFIFSFCVLATPILHAQTFLEYGTLHRFSLKNAVFPHPKRVEGHTYQNKKFTAEQHYQDSTVLVFVPKDFRFSTKTDIVVHFHGWSAIVDNVVTKFKLIEQFAAAHPNALLIVPQGPKNAPDSFGGKLEEEEGFQKLIDETLRAVAQVHGRKTLEPRNIILSGHSGAYRVMSFILLHGGLAKNIREVWIFDGLYGQLEKFSVWLQQPKARFVNIYTKEGGTFSTSLDFETDILAWRLPFWKGEEKDLTEGVLHNHRILSLFTPLEHNEVLAKTGLFQRLLSASPFLKH
jgi:hypothetical protein